MKLTFLTAALALLPLWAMAAEIPTSLPRQMTEQEVKVWPRYLEQVQKENAQNIESLPSANVHSLGEWEESEGVMINWKNASLVKALAENGNVKALATSESDKNSWVRFIGNQNIESSRVSFYVTSLDSMWVRDYGPWWIVDGTGTFGIVDTIYNRPRPRDDVFPQFVADQLKVPIFKPNLVHTGGNYYNDGLGNAFSSTLVFDENRKFSAQEIFDVMLKYLGIKTYLTSDLGKRVTIEHLDTFGKLVAPDTWVFSQFPTTSQFYKDSEAMVAKLRNMKSPYGTPYKIHRLKMISNGGDSYYRAYINSFISNGVLYFPGYGDSIDQTVKETYQAALPGYKIVPVDAQGTEWGDSVHCRTRNIMKKNTIFIFPTISVGRTLTVKSEIHAPAGTNITHAEVVVQDEFGSQVYPLAKEGDLYVAQVPANPRGPTKLFIRATNSAGLVKTHPRFSSIEI